MSSIFYKTRSDLFRYFADTAKSFFQNALALIFLFFAVRIFEYFFISHLHSLPVNSLMLMLSGIPYDLLFSVKISCYAIIPYFIVSYVAPKLADILFGIVAILLLICNLLLITYYSKSLVPLGADLFGYTFQEIRHTVQASGGLNFLTLLSLALAAFLFAIVFRVSRKILLPKFILYFLAASFFAAFFFADDLAPQTGKYKTDLEYYTVINKMQFFEQKVLPYLLNDNDEVISGDYFIDSVSDPEQSFLYVNKYFPFLRLDSSRNVLGQFFKTTTELPNFVFIITESLGKSYSGEGAMDGSFTPFLDSLARSSLYWKNFLSTSGRTFAAFSSLFGSLPFAEKGFLDLGEKMPPHFTLISFLKQLGYTADFFHGGDAHFDNMDVFFKRQKIDFILSDKNFGGGYKKMPPNAEGFSWGYGDKELFKRSFELIDQQKKSPRIDVYLTLSIHDPFLIDGQEYYRNKVRAQLQTLPLTVQQKAEYEKYLDKFATIMYTDEAFKYFFDEYKKRDEFKNTIFVITGDHRMPEIPIKTKLDRFHVPFLIYSPMLKQYGVFASVSTHFDVLPSLMAFLRDQYNVITPKYVTWLGSGIDTARNFRNTHSAPLMRNKNELLDFIAGEYFLADEEVFGIFDNMSLSKTNDAAAQRSLQNSFNAFKVKNKMMTKTKELLPDSVLRFLPVVHQPDAKK